MDIPSLIRAVLALVFTLGLVGLAAWAARRFGPRGMFALAAPAHRRLKVVETLALDPARRLVLVSFDGRERLLLLGEGRTLETQVRADA